MPKLIQNITGSIYLPSTGVAQFTKEIEGQIGEGTYFKVYGLEVLQQDFSRVEDYEIFNTPPRFGLSHNGNKTVKEISINK